MLRNGGAIWLTNVIVFALWYWEMDRGGPAARACGTHEYPDFLFTQMTAPELVAKDWEPAFLDYLYLSFTNATAFSPTDTLPLSRWAKMTMMFQSAVSLVTVALVVARAVNVLEVAGGPARGAGRSAGPEQRRAVGEIALGGDVLGPALRRLHPDRRIAEAGQVVRAGPHVDRTDLPGQREAVRDEFAGDQRRQLVSPLVEIHVRVQTAGLFECGLGGTGRLQHVAGGPAAVKNRNASKWLHRTRWRPRPRPRSRRLSRSGQRRGGPRPAAAGRPSPTRACRSSRTAVAATRCRQHVGIHAIASPRRAGRLDIERDAGGRVR